MPKVPIVIIGAALVLLLLAPVNSPIYNIIMVLAVLPVIVVLGACAILGNRTGQACSFLGRLSYPLYLIHTPVLRMANRIGERMHHGVSPWGLMLGGSIVSVIAAEVLRIAFDEPVRRWLSRVQRGPSAEEALQLR
jgi:peptidoglycan/LPS O-acetylase OafA/YrhL